MTTQADELRAALCAITDRDVGALTRLLDDHPGLIGARTAGCFSDTLLHFAAKENDVVGVATLLWRGADLEAWTYASPLHAAAGSPSADAMELLLAAGARVEGRRGASGESALGYAVLHGSRREADLLVRHGAAVDAHWLAAGVGDLDAIASYFDEGGRLKRRAFEGRVSLLDYGDYGVDPPDEVDTPDFVVDEALTFACMNSRLAAAVSLLARGARIDARTHVGTPLHWAAYRGHREIVRFLLHEGADPAIRDRAFGGTPAGWADQTGQREVSDLLRARESDRSD